ncbi:MAG: hypothetical protein ACW99G_12930 [Candidatus Thorarchaeota archaeon]|jgi:hypothetical protein
MSNDNSKNNPVDFPYSHEHDPYTEDIEDTSEDLPRSIKQLTEAINTQCGESFDAVPDGEWYRLFNAGVNITEGCDFEVHLRLKQIAKENGVELNES